MKLKSLDIDIMPYEEFSRNIKKILEGDLKSVKFSQSHSRSLGMASIEVFKKSMTPNKLQILMAISRLKPKSINQLSKLLGREFPHVLKDCRALEVEGFIKFEEVDSLRKQLTPKLVFDYDIIRVKAPIEEIYSISERSNKVLLRELKP